MTISKIKTLHKDPILLITLFAMIASTLISFLLVSKNNHKIDILESEIRDKKAMIRELSANISQKQNQVNALLLLDFVAEKKAKEAEKIKEKYLRILPKLNVKSSAMEILEEFEKQRNAQFEQIDNFYITQISLEKEKQVLEQKNKIYGSIATFLQIIGLALIILRKDFSLDNLY